MAILHMLISVVLMVRSATAWSLTNYYNVSTTPIGETVSTELISVTPTGSVSAISSNSSTTTSVLYDPVYLAYGVTYNVTVTNMFVAPDGAWCAQFGTQKRCSATTSFPPQTTATVTTRYWAPLTISNPASCTKTSFSYTSSQQQYPDLLGPGELGDLNVGSVLSAEATEVAQMLFITTYVVTVSTDMGGQAVTTSVVDVYLKSDAVQGVIPMSEASLLSECVDPSSLLCQTSSPAVGDYGCGPTDPITYPPRSAAATGGVSPTGSGSSTAVTTSKKSGVGGRRSTIHLGLSLGVVVLTTVLLVVASN